MNEGVASEQTHGFAFRRFRIVHRSSAWKVGTDSILLGSWCDVHDAVHLLDIGTGSGILALMLAQRTHAAHIDAVEIHEPSAREAEANISASPWAGRITIFPGDVRDVTSWPAQVYDHIVSNPPYFNRGKIRFPTARQFARHGIGFTLMNLPRIAAPMLHAEGKLSVVMPAMHAYHFIAVANLEGLYVRRRLNVRHTKESPIRIVLLELGKTIADPQNDMIALYAGNRPSSEYNALTAECVSFSGEKNVH